MMNPNHDIFFIRSSSVVEGPMLIRVGVSTTKRMIVPRGREASDR